MSGLPRGFAGHLNHWAKAVMRSSIVKTMVKDMSRSSRCRPTAVVPPDASVSWSAICFYCVAAVIVVSTPAIVLAFPNISHCRLFAPRHDIGPIGFKATPKQALRATRTASPVRPAASAGSIAGSFHRLSSLKSPQALQDCRFPRFR